MPLSEIIGHRRLIALLSRAIAQDTLPQSLLFAGADGVGKRRTAVALAETLNCLEPVTPPSIKSFGMRNPFSPNAARSTPKPT